jgi:hypothetical protein
MPENEAEKQPDVEKIKYPFPASIKCPACGHISIYYHEKHAKYLCLNENCGAEDIAFEKILDKKARLKKQLRDLWEQSQ